MEAVKVTVEKTLDEMSNMELKKALPRKLLVELHKNMDDIKWATLTLNYLKCVDPEFKDSGKNLNESDFQSLWSKWSGKGS